MAKVVRFHTIGGPEVLRIEDIAVPPPGPGEVQLRVKALGLNRAEALLRSGRYIETATLPSGLGLEAAGLIEATGRGVEELVPGDAVSVIPPISMVRWPVHAELVNLPANLVAKHPSWLGWDKAAALWMAYLTAYGMLVDLAQLRADDTVIITAASSSVGLAAIQIARSVGATTIAVTRTDDKVVTLKTFGVDHAIVADANLAGSLTAIVGPRGARVVIDPVGGPIFGPLTVAMARGGMLMEYGGLSAEPTPFPLGNVLSKMLTLRGYLVHEITGDKRRLDAAKAYILAGLESGAFSPTIDRTFPLDQIVEAHRHLESNTQFGKIVVTI